MTIKVTVVQSDEERLIFGKQEIVESVLGLEFTISPESFFQTNTKGAELLYSRAFDLSGDLSGKTVFDLYSGTGTIGQLIASIRADILNMLMDIKKNDNTGFLYISHDIPTTQFIADKIFLIK